MLDLTASPEVVAPQLLGAVLRRVTPDGTDGTDGTETVAVQLTEVEAYPGVGDPASHTARGWTPRCATMFGPPGHIYVYASYGIHRAGNIVCRPAGTGAGVLMRAGRVVEGLDVARRRRTRLRDGVAVVPADEALGRGPGNLGAVLGLDLDLDGSTLHVVGGDGGRAGGRAAEDTDAAFTLTPPASPVEHVHGPRIGISKNVEAPLRFWIPGDRTVTTPRGRPKGV
ncbi:DNA-3-methyladenine glycosylase [Corynebacterium variabile]|uniref:DNA-3-methyladenine glycosylase n=1 Tax=Corynebacterium variabile TaxID=1727 RepID=UPI002FE1A15D